MDESKKVKPPRLDGLIFVIALGIATAWGWWVMEQFTDLRLTRKFGVAHEDPVSIWIPLIATPAVVGSALWYWRHMAAFAKHGVVVPGTILRFGASASGMKDVAFAYEYEGTKYETKESVSSERLKDKSVGDLVDVAVDTRKPKRAMLNW